MPAHRLQKRHTPAHSRRPENPSSTTTRRRGLSIVAVLAAALLAGGYAETAASAAGGIQLGDPVSYTTVAADYFNRNVAAGLGEATVGGSYDTWLPGDGQSDVNAGEASVRSLRPGGSFGAWLPSVRIDEVQSSVSIRVPSVDSSYAGLYFATELRRQADGSAYRLKLKIAADGHLALILGRVRADQTEVTLARKSLPLTAAANQKIVLAARVTNVDPVLLAVQAYAEGTKAPGWQLVTEDGGKERITQAGGLGFWSYVSTVGTAREYALSNLHGFALAQPTPPTPPTAPSTGPSASPGSSAPSSSSPSSSSLSPSSSAPPSSPSTKPSSSPPSTSSAPSTPPATSPPPTPAPVPTPTTEGRGSLPVGAAQYAVPAGALFVAPGGADSQSGSAGSPLRTVGAAVSRASAGQTIVLRSGTYNEQIFVAAGKSVTVQAYPGESVWFDGSTPVTNWARTGSSWTATGWNAQFDHSASFTRGSDAGGFVNSSYPMAAWPDQMFVDGAKLRQVPAGSLPGPGQFSVNYAAHSLTLGSDPSGHDVRASNLEKAFVIAGKVNLLGVGVRRYATPLPAIATVYYGGNGGGTVQNVVVQDNATQGLSLSAPNATVDHVTAVNNGMTGIHSNNGVNLTIENSVISSNNSEHFNSAPAAAGMKVTRVRGLLVKNNDVFDNGACGLWTDVSVTNFTIVNNTVTNNVNCAVLVELSDTGIIANNRLSGSKDDLYIYDTGNVRVFNNQFAGSSRGSVFVSQDARRSGDPNCPWIVRNLTIDNNVFAPGAPGSIFQFYVLDKATRTPADAMNIVIDGNQFMARTTSADPWAIAWGGGDNTALSLFATPSAFTDAKNKPWTNLAVSPTLRSLAVTNVAVALPADVAAAIGVPAATRHMGPF